jgi:hypothetical protein
LCLSRQELAARTHDEKKGLTENLTPQQWNTLLVGLNRDSTECLDSKVLFYTTFYSNKARLDMMATALESGLEYLFKAMVDPAYAPRSPHTIPLLEQGMAKYPEIRQACLFTMHNLGHPVHRWHFTSSKEDLDTLEDLIDDALVTRKCVISKLMDITEVDSGGLAEFVMSKQLLTQDDLCNAKRYQEACAAGRLRYLLRVEKFCPSARPSQQSIDAAVSGGFLGIIMFFETILEIKVLPSQKAVDAAAGKMELEALKVRCHQWKRFPGRFGADVAAENGRLDVLQWMAKLDPPVVPNETGANSAARSGNLEVLKWMAKLSDPVFPDQAGANSAAWYGKLEVLKWMAALSDPVFPNQDGANNAAEMGYLELLKWMAELSDPVFPDQHGANRAAWRGKLEVLKWMQNALNPPVVPNETGASNAARSGNLEVLKWMAKLSDPVFPDQAGANSAAWYGKLEVLKWMAALSDPVFPNQDGANNAAEMGYLELLKWMTELSDPVFPDQHGANRAARSVKLEVLKWMAALTPPVFPNQDGANHAAWWKHPEVLKWMATLDPPLTPNLELYIGLQ